MNNLELFYSMAGFVLGMLTTALVYLRVVATRKDEGATQINEDAPNVYVEAAKPLVEWADTVEEWSGEAKRHQVYARLIKQFPEANKRDLALAIELSLK